MKFKVVLYDTKDGLAVSCPELPGCYSQGRTEQEALENIQEAILCHLTALAKVNRAKRR